MIYVSDINNLISQWTDRLKDSSYPVQYRDALFECCFDLDNLLKKSFDEEIASRESFTKQLEEVSNAA